MQEMHLKQPGFSYSVCGPFTKNKERIKKFKETRDASYIYKNELDQPCFQHNMASDDFKDLKRKTVSDKMLRDKAFNIAKNPKHDGYQRGLASMVYRFFNKNSASLADKFVAGDAAANNEIKQNFQLAEELHKPIFRKSKKEKFILDLKIIFWEL